MDRDGVPTKRDSYIQLMQSFPVFSPAFSQGLFSSESAPGLIIGSGVISESLIGGEQHSVFVSTTGGKYCKFLHSVELLYNIASLLGTTWTESLRGVYKFAVGDHGGLIVAVNGLGRTSDLLYSWDEGLTWQTLKISEKKLRVISIMTEMNGISPFSICLVL